MKRKPPTKVRVVRRKLGRQQADGLCTWDGKVHVDERLKGIVHLETLLHELLHHVFPFLEEDAIDAAAKTMATSMHDDHWRRVEQ